LIILVYITIALLEYGWMFLKAQQLSDAARQGARVAILSSATNALVMSAISNVMTQGGMGSAPLIGPVLTPSDVATVPSGSPITVSVKVAYDGMGTAGIRLFHGLNFAPPWPLPVPTNLRGAVTMNKEGPGP